MPKADTASTPLADPPIQQPVPADQPPQAPDDSREQRVRDAAYRRYEARIQQGDTSGDAESDWAAAEAEISDGPEQPTA